MLKKKSRKKVIEINFLNCKERYLKVKEGLTENGKGKRMQGEGEKRGQEKVN
jgi:hypothetical protein